MKLAIMQPYIFPYLGYFQLIQKVDKFVFYDDVDFIKGGWINRNRIQSKGKEILFTVPLDKPSSNKKINDTALNQQLYKRWLSKFIRTIDQSYSKSPYFDEIRPLLLDLFSIEHVSISDLAKASILLVSEYLNLDTFFVGSSVIYKNSHLNAQTRVIDICVREQADTYINASGGIQLYSTSEFSKQGIRLQFIKPSLNSYNQNSTEEFLPGLSILDILMNEDPSTVRYHLEYGTIHSKEELCG